MDEFLAPIKQRILQYIDYKGLKKGDFFSIIEVSPSNFRSKSLKSEVGGDVIAKISSLYPDINPSWLLLGEEPMLKESGIEKHILAPGDTIPKGAIPYWDLPVSAGHSIIDVIGSKDPVGYIKNLPGIEMTEAILPITGMSMEPEISNGAIIGVRKIDNWETLNTERIYLIITHDDRMIKRIEYDNEDPAILWCLSPNYAKFKIYKNDIIEVQRVCFVFNPK